MLFELGYQLGSRYGYWRSGRQRAVPLDDRRVNSRECPLKRFHGMQGRLVGRSTRPYCPSRPYDSTVSVKTVLSWSIAHGDVQRWPRGRGLSRTLLASRGVSIGGAGHVRREGDVVPLGKVHRRVLRPAVLKTIGATVDTSCSMVWI
jgi:hypothetical protein